MNKKQLLHFVHQAEELCKQRDCRLTDQRKTVLELVLASEKPLTAYEILDRLRESIKNPAPPTVYRALDFLLEHGLIHKLESIHAYIGCSHPDHEHISQFLICNDCGDVNEIDNKAIERSLHSAEEAAGFKTSHPVIELLGTCSQCQLSNAE
jgi:Fur family zinc uptake transcriptional regulator